MVPAGEPGGGEASTETSTEYWVGPPRLGTPTVGARTVGSDTSDIRKNEALHRKCVRNGVITMKLVLLLGFVG